MEAEFWSLRDLPKKSGPKLTTFYLKQILSELYAGTQRFPENCPVKSTPRFLSDMFENGPRECGFEDDPESKLEGFHCSLWADQG